MQPVWVNFQPWNLLKAIDNSSEDFLCFDEINRALVHRFVARILVKMDFGEGFLSGATNYKGVA